MIRRIGQIVVGFIPFYLFLGWAFFIVQPQLENHLLRAIAMLLLGLAVMGCAQGLIFKLWLLPAWAGAISERLYAGSYFPEDDPIASLAAQIFSQHRPDLIPELERLVLADASRTRAWLELARALELEAHDHPRAAEALQRGAKAVKDRDDAAMLLWRAFVLLNKNPTTKKEANALLEHLRSEYSSTTYGRLAASTYAPKKPSPLHTRPKEIDGEAKH